MPNMKGGKKYKSAKSNDDKPDFHEIGEGQTIARVLKHLGDRNVLVYCDDGEERIAHIRGSLTKKKAMIDVGDIVLISHRGEEMTSDSKKLDRADILAKYDRSLYNQLKKMNFNSKLFSQGESQKTEDVGYTFDSESEGEEEEDKPAYRTEREKEQEKGKGKRTFNFETNEEIDIDGI